jgi:adenylate cyclase class 2
MNENDQEIEAKFYVRDLQALQGRALAQGASLLHARHLESNLRFDTPRRSLTRAGRVLRLRLPAPTGEAGAAVLTYKGPPKANAAVHVRQEIEVIVSDLEAARRLLHALNFSIVASYEKYRTEYRLDAVDLAFDELPYGHFIEIEGHNETEIEAAATALGLKWQARAFVSYMGLFERICQKRNLPLTHLTFSALSGMSFSPAELELEFAD